MNIIESENLEAVHTHTHTHTHTSILSKRMENTYSTRTTVSKIRNKNGITLVALVITIIILLMLAGISIASLTGDRLFEKTMEVKEKYENEEIGEKNKLEDYEKEISKYMNIESNTEEQYFIITYMNNGESFQKKVIKGEKCDLVDIEREGYIFLGWSLQENGSIIEDNYIPNSDITLYAQWIAKNYVYQYGKKNPNFNLIQYKQSNGSSTIKYLENSISISTPATNSAYHWGGIGIEEKVDVTNYNSLVVKYYTSCKSTWFLTTNDDINKITSNINQQTITGMEFTLDLSNYSGSYYIGMWPQYSVNIVEMFFD